MSVESINSENQTGSRADVTSAMPSDFYRLLKPRVMVLVIFTAIIGMLMAPGAINPLLAFISILCISIGAGASGALNMWYDADIDAIMDRTAKRPIPDGRVEANEAFSFGIILSVFSVAVLGILVNWLAAFLLGFTIFFYAVIYTMWLKRSTPQNIVIGGAAGAFPPMIGWACVTGSVTIESIILFAIIFLWTPPHFWALALWRLQDYDSAGVPMMPNVKGVKSTRNQILAYSIPLAISGILPALLGFASIYYGVVAIALNGRFAWLAYKVWAEGSSDDNYAHEKKLFGYSIFYLFALFGAFGIDAIAMRIL